MEELADSLGQARRKAESSGEEVKTGEVFPSDSLAAVIPNNRQLKPAVFPMRWGFERKRRPRHKRAGARRRGEKKLSRDPLQPLPHPGELLPSSGERRADGCKVKYAIRPKGQAALSRRPHTKPGAGEPCRRFTILTRKAADGISYKSTTAWRSCRGEASRLALPAADARRAAGRCEMDMEYSEAQLA